MFSILVVLVVLPVMLYALLNVNAVQHYIVNRVGNYFAQELQTEISIGSVDIRLFRSVVLKDVVVKDQVGEKLLAANKLDVQLSNLSIREKSIEISNLHLKNASLDLYKTKEQADHNFQFILDYFNDRDPRPEDDRWHFGLMAFQLSQSDIHYRDESQEPWQVGFDPSHFQLSDLNLHVTNIHQDVEFTAFRIEEFRYRESPGFKLDHLAADVTIHDNRLAIDNFLIQTEGTDVTSNLEIEFPSDIQFADFPGEAQFFLTLDNSRVDLADVGHYYRSLHGLSDVLHLHGNISGSGHLMNGDDLQLSYGENTYFHGDVVLKNPANGLSPHLTLNVRELKSSIKDIQAFRLPSAWDDAYPVLPGNLEALGDIAFTGFLKGNLNDFLAEGSLNTSVGSLQSDIRIFKSDKADKGYHYRGYMAASNVDLDRLFNNPDMPAEVTMNAELEGSGFRLDNLEMNIDGAVESMMIRDVRYSNLVLAGDFENQRFDGDLSIRDENLSLGFHGIVDLESLTPVFQFNVQLEHANLTNMKLFRRDELYESIIAADLFINASGSGLDDMEGEMTIRDIRYTEMPADPNEPEIYPQTYYKDSIYVSSTLWSEDNQHVRLRSDFADIDVHGTVSFDRLIESVQSFAGQYLPAAKLGTPVLAGKETPVFDQDVNFSLRMKDTHLLSELFLPAVSLSYGAWIYGTFHARNGHLFLEGHADTLTLAGRSFINYEIRGEENDIEYGFTMRADSVMLSEQTYLENFILDNTFRKDSILSEVFWGNDDMASGSGYLKGTTHFVDEHLIEISIPQSRVNINGNTWRFNTDNKILLDSNRVEIYQLKAYYDDQFIKADGVLSAAPGDRMGLSFADFDVAYTSLLLGDRNFDFGGILDGHVSFTGLYQSPGIAADVFVKDFSFNKDLMGDLDLHSTWNDQRQAFDVHAAITYHGNVGSNQPLIASGHLYTGDHDQNFDLDIDLTNFKMSVWGRYMESFAENFRGIASGQLRMEGAFSRPDLSGNLRLSRMGMHIPYLNTSYTFAHEVEIEKDRFHFENLVLNDTIGNTALVNGSIMHDYFGNFSIDIDARPENLIVLNTTAASEEVFFGTAFVTGLARFHGFTNDITLDVSASTNRGTRIMMPLNYTGDIRERHFISFVSPDEDGAQPASLLFQPGGDLTLNFDLEVTPDAEVELFFDSQFGDIIRGRGNGDINLEIAPDGSFNIYGDYFIESGEYLFSLQNIINKRFSIEQGSNIRWTGDINDADVDLRAMYRLRTSLYDLFAGGGADDEMANQFRRRVPVETLLLLEGKLFNPDISFDITVPGGDDAVRELIEREITTDQEMNRQVFSLLVLNRFLPRDQTAAIGYGMGATSSELLSHQLSNWLSQISSDFDIGVNYRPGDEITSQEVELALSTQLFDDRVLIDGNFGVAGSQTATGQQTQATNQFIGDVNVEVKITPEGKFRVKAFNRSNTFDIIHTNAPYTQGIGFFYRKEFDRLQELFRRQRPTEVPASPDEDSGVETSTSDLK